MKVQKNENETKTLKTYPVGTDFCGHDFFAQLCAADGVGACFLQLHAIVRKSTGFRPMR